MSRIKQATPVTGSAIDAAIRDERITELERRTEFQAKRLKCLEAALGPWLEEMVMIMDGRDHSPAPE